MGFRRSGVRISPPRPDLAGSYSPVVRQPCANSGGTLPPFRLWIYLGKIADKRGQKVEVVAFWPVLSVLSVRVSAIKCYLTGERLANGEFSIRRLRIKDKHGLIRTAFNAKVNIYRELADPILLGIEDKKLAPSQQPA